MRHRLIATSLLAAVGGCALPGRDLADAGQAALAKAPLCCRTLAEAARKPLPADGKQAPVLPIDAANAQAAEFDGGKAFFLVFELPPFSEPYSVTISGLASGPLHDVAVFVPRVALLDASFATTRSFDDRSLRRRGDELERTVFFNADHATERYLVVSGSSLAAPLERTYSAVTSMPVFTGTGFFNMVNGADTKSVLRSSPTGSIRIQANGLGAG